MSELRLSRGVVEGLTFVIGTRSRIQVREAWANGLTALISTGRGNDIFFFKPTDENRQILKGSRMRWREWNIVKMRAMTQEWWSE